MGLEPTTTGITIAYVAIETASAIRDLPPAIDAFFYQIDLMYAPQLA